MINKLLHIDNLRFKLPDDFNGSLSDSFRLLADYLDTPKEKIEQPKELTMEDLSKITLKESNETVWKEFINTLEMGRKLHCTLHLCELVNNEWKDLSLKTGGGL